MENYDFCLRPRGRYLALLSLAVSIAMFAFSGIYLPHEAFAIERDKKEVVVIIAVIVFFVSISVWFIIKYLGMFLEKIYVKGDNITICVYRKRQYSLSEITEARIEYISGGNRPLECLTPYFNGKKCWLFLEIGEHMHNYDLWRKYLQDAGVKITTEEDNG